MGKNGTELTAEDIMGVGEPLPDGMAQTFYPERRGPRDAPRQLDAELAAIKDAVLALKTLAANRAALRRAMVYLNARFEVK